MIRLIFLLMLGSVVTSSAQNKPKTNKHFWETGMTSSSPEKIWETWNDVSSWKSWDEGLKDALMDEDFKLDAKGKIISLEGRKTTFKVVEFVDGQSYTIKTQLPLSALYVKRYLEVKEGKTFFTHEVWFKGLTSGIFARQFGSTFRSMLPKVIQNIKSIAEK